jgi:hypothetical protein
MGNFGSFWGKSQKFWSFSVKNGRFWPFGVPGKVATPENYFDRRVPQKRARRDEQHAWTQIIQNKNNLIQNKNNLITRPRAHALQLAHRT